jgi:hypothetical protein
LTLQSNAPALGVFLVIACGAGEVVPDAGVSDAGNPVDAGTPGDAGSPNDAGGPGDAGISNDAGTPDGGSDAGSMPGQLPACAGTQRLPLRLQGKLVYVNATLGTAPNTGSGPFLVDFATTASAVDLSRLSAPGPAYSGCQPDAGNFSPCTFTDLDFFGSWGQVVMNPEQFSGSQAGIIGTDFLSVHPFSIDYVSLELVQGPSPFCSDAELEAAGFVALSSQGFYAKQLSALRLLTDVDPSAPVQDHVPNVPTVPVRIAGVTALAQLDTGFDDNIVPSSVNVNQAFIGELIDGGAVQRDSAHDLSLSTCVGVSEPVQAYRLAPGVSFDFVGVDGGTARAEATAVLFAKNTPPAARVCGGIGTWSVPAAQVAASFYVVAGHMVFDPVASQVWIPR